MSTVELFCPKCEWRWAPPPVVGLPGFVSLDEPCPHCGNEFMIEDLDDLIASLREAKRHLAKKRWAP